MNSRKKMLMGVIVLILITGFGAIYYFLSMEKKPEPADEGMMIDFPVPKQVRFEVNKTPESDSQGKKPVHPSANRKKSGEAGTQIVAVREAGETDSIPEGGASAVIPPSGSMVAMGKSAKANRSVDIADAGIISNETGDSGINKAEIADRAIAAAPPPLPAGSSGNPVQKNEGRLVLTFDVSPDEIYENGKLIYRKDNTSLPEGTEIKDEGRKFIFTRPVGSYAYAFLLQNKTEIRNINIPKGTTEYPVVKQGIVNK